MLEAGGNPDKVLVEMLTIKQQQASKGVGSLPQMCMDLASHMRDELKGAVATLQCYSYDVQADLSLVLRIRHDWLL